MSKPNFQCRQCGFTDRVEVWPVTCMCGHRTVSPLPLGDWVAKGLEAVGIQKTAGCGCSQRQSWLNQAGAKIAGK